MSYTRAIVVKSVLLTGRHTCFCDTVCQVGSANGNRSGSVGETFQKAYLEEWVYSGDDSSDEQGFAKFLALVQGLGNKGYISK